jgi:hypothetical protein
MQLKAVGNRSWGTPQEGFPLFQGFRSILTPEESRLIIPPKWYSESQAGVSGRPLARQGTVRLSTR